MSMPQPEIWLEQAVSIVEEAGMMLASTLEEDHSVAYKGEIDLVTEMDRRSESFIVQRLEQVFPGTGILAEEGTQAGSAARASTWILDPLDGTTNYAHGLPVFCVSLALEVEGRLELGVVHDPTRRETFTALRGAGARLNGRPLRVTTEAAVGRALLATGFPYDIRVSSRTNLAQFGIMAVRAQGIRRGGSAALDLAYVAAGRLDGFWEEKIAVWDVAAGVLLVQEAGGMVTDYAGRPVDIRGGRILATNGAIHREMAAILGELEERSG